MSLQKIGDYIDSGAGRTTISVVLVIVFMVIPVLFLFADSSARLLPGPLTPIYADLERVVGIAPARILFCGAWFAFGVAPFWHLVRKRGIETGR